MGKTVTTYLIDGDPKGTQYSFISNKICQMFVVPPVLPERTGEATEAGFLHIDRRG